MNRTIEWRRTGGNRYTVTIFERASWSGIPFIEGDVITIPLSPMPTYWQKLLGIVGFPAPDKPPVLRQFMVISISDGASS